MAAGVTARVRKVAELLYRELVGQCAKEASAWQAYAHCLQSQGQMRDAELAFKSTPAQNCTLSHPILNRLISTPLHSGTPSIPSPQKSTTGLGVGTALHL